MPWESSSFTLREGEKLQAIAPVVSQAEEEAKAEIETSGKLRKERTPISGAPPSR